MYLIIVIWCLQAGIPHSQPNANTMLMIAMRRRPDFEQIRLLYRYKYTYNLLTLISLTDSLYVNGIFQTTVHHNDGSGKA